MSTLFREIGDGLVLRSAVPADTQQLMEFHAALHSDDGPGSPDAAVGAWVQDLMAGSNPTFKPEDFTVVEETASGKIVSSLCLLSETWSYEGIPFGFGQPELVATLPEFRRRGLIRAQMEIVHQWSRERGHLVQGITGIPNYYRQFGYEMAVDLEGGRTGYKALVPVLAEGQAEPYRLRPAQVSDIPVVESCYRAGCRRGPLACERDETLWRYELEGKRERNVNRRALQVIESAGGEAVGFVAHPAQRWHKALHVTAFELVPGVSWLAVAPSVMRALWSIGEDYASRDGRGPIDAISFTLGSTHPAYDVLRRRLPHVRPPYGWYLRVPDLVAFVQRIAPALEERLARSLVCGPTGRLRLSFYRSGLELTFAEGRLTAVAPWQPLVEQWGEAALPGLTFLQLLFGYRNLDAIEDAFPDGWADGDDVRVVLDALFPARPSNLWCLT